MVARRLSQEPGASAGTNKAQPMSFLSLGDGNLRQRKGHGDKSTPHPADAWVRVVLKAVGCTFRGSGRGGGPVAARSEGCAPFDSRVGSRGRGGPSAGCRSKRENLRFRRQGSSKVLRVPLGQSDAMGSDGGKAGLNLERAGAARDPMRLPRHASLTRRDPEGGAGHARRSADRTARLRDMNLATPQFLQQPARGLHVNLPRNSSARGPLPSLQEHSQRTIDLLNPRVLQGRRIEQSNTHFFILRGLPIIFCYQLGPLYHKKEEGGLLNSPRRRQNKSS